MIKYNIHKYQNIDITNDEEILHYVIYSHTEYLDILEIQMDFITGKGHLTLFINRNNVNLDYIYNKFDKVIFYDEKLTYGQKLLSCLVQIDYDYFILIHDNDILINNDNNKMIWFLNFLRKNDFDRVDFQLAYDFDETHIINNDDLYLIQSSNIDTRAKGYIYNVNPSMWKRTSLMEIMEKFNYKDYRTIEADEVQEFCLKFNIFKLYSRKKYRCGYFICLEPFRYLHITHYGGLFNPYSIPIEDSKDIIDIYNKILEKYKLEKWK